MDLPGTSTTTLDLANAFALEGLTNNQQLRSVEKAGDVNRDGEQDFLVTGSSGESYLLYGPIAQSSLFRATSSDLNSKNVVDVRGDSWSFTQSFDKDAAGNALFEALAPSVRASGRATVIFDSSLGKVVGSGQILGDSASDVVFLKDTGTNFVLNIVAGAQTLGRNVSTATKSIQIAKPAGWTTVDELQVQLLDWTGPNASGGDGLSDIVIIGKPDNPLTQTVAGYVFSGATIAATSAPTQANALFTIATDSTSRLVAAQFLGAGSSLDTSIGSNLISTTAGDVNRDGFEDLIIADSTFAKAVGAPDQDTIGRVYLIPGRRSSLVSGTIPLLTGGPATVGGTGAYTGLASYVWQDFTIGASVAGVGDSNRDGFADIAFTRSHEKIKNAPTGEVLGSAFVIAGSVQYSTFPATLNSANLPRPGFAPDGQRNEMLGRLDRVVGASDVLTLAAGDFDGNGESDLAVSNQNLRSVRMFYDFASKAIQLPETVRTYANHDGDILGTNDTGLAGGFGSLSSTPGLDLDGDSVADLIIGAPMVDVSTSIITPNADAGRVYVFFGNGRTLGLPPERSEELLTNREVPKGGLYLVERPDGQPFRYSGAESTTLTPQELDQWFSFEFLGDGQIGDVLKLRVDNGITQAISRPEKPRLYSTSASVAQTGLTGIDSLDPLQFVLPMSIAGYSNTQGLVTTIPATGWDIGGTNPSDNPNRQLMLDLDLSRLFDLAESPELLSEVNIVLPFSHPNPAAGSVAAKLVDRESDGVLAADDGVSSTDRFRHTPRSFSTTVKPAQVSGTVELNVTQEVRDAIAAGKTRLTFRIESDVANPIRIADGAARIDIQTSRRDGVVADLFDAEGRRLIGGPNASSIMDLRTLPAGKYHIRVFDPFSEPSHNLYDTNYNPVLNRSNIQFVVEIEAPKVGEADAQSDRDELRGGNANDVLEGNGYYDRLFGGLGTDTFVGESVEVRDFNYKLPTEATDTITSVATGQEGYLIARPDDFVITTFADPTLELAVANKLGLASIDANGTLRLTRPLRATDLTALVELDADPFSLGRLDGNVYPYTLSSIRGLEYATNLEYLTLAKQNISSLASIEPGIRLGREEQGELGLKSLRFIDLDGNPLQVSNNETYPESQIGPLHVLGRLSKLESISIDTLTGATNANLNSIPSANTYYDLAFTKNLQQLRWLSTVITRSRRFKMLRWIAVMLVDRLLLVGIRWIRFPGTTPTTTSPRAHPRELFSVVSLKHHRCRRHRV